MLENSIQILRQILKKFDIGIVRQSTLQRLLDQQNAAQELAILKSLPPDHLTMLFKLMPNSTAQLRQDIFVLSELNFKPSGFFVEFGATNGVTLSNTYLLEKNFGWTGILAEPARCWHDSLRKNRAAIIETKCVWKTSGSMLDFNEVQAAELSTIGDFSNRDMHRFARKHGQRYKVESISLLDLLINNSAPKEIDYLSIDTEGSEFEILEAFNFNDFRFKTITCEHNFSSMRDPIFQLLSRNGYVRKYTEASQFDDWYVRES